MSKLDFLKIIKIVGSVLCWWRFGCARTNPPLQLHYDTTGIRHNAFKETNRAHLMKQITLRSNGPVMIQRNNEPSRVVSLEELEREPLSVLAGLRLFMDNMSLGAEADRLIWLEEEGRIPVSIYLDMDSNISYIMPRNLNL